MKQALKQRALAWPAYSGYAPRAWIGQISGTSLEVQSHYYLLHRVLNTDKRPQHSRVYSIAANDSRKIDIFGHNVIISSSVPIQCAQLFWASLAEKESIPKSETDQV